jgi:hypothetical protein
VATRYMGGLKYMAERVDSASGAAGNSVDQSPTIRTQTLQRSTVGGASPSPRELLTRTLCLARRWSATLDDSVLDLK